MMLQTPTFEPPDELSHLLYIVNFRKTGALPTMHESPEAIFASQDVQRHHPPLYYMLGALLLNVTPISDHDFSFYRHPNLVTSMGVVNVNNQHVFLHPYQGSPDFLRAIYLLRGINLLISAATLWLIYRIGRALGDETLGLLSAALAAFIPTFLFISGSINNDPLSSFFYTAGLCWVIERWQTRTLGLRQSVLIAVILAGSALTKINGLSLFGLVYGALALGALLGRWRWRDALSGVAISALVPLVLAGWWYWRNVELYGDPLAVSATARIWARSTPAEIREIGGIWVSFWAILGHFNIRGPEWLFTYADILTLGGLSGALVYTWRQTNRMVWLILWAAIGLVMATIFVATLRINISQGRLLYPILGAFAVLVMQGWRVWLPRRQLAAVVLVPLLAAALTSPFWLADAYRPLGVEAIPPDATRIAASTDTFVLAAYQLPGVVTMPDTLNMRVWFNVQQQPAADYALAVAVLDGRTNEVRGNAIIYPGMTRTSLLTPLTDGAYTAAFQLALNDDVPFAPNQSRVELRWVRVEFLNGAATTTETQLWYDGENRPIAEYLSLSGPSLVHPDNIAPAPAESLQITFGDAIVLEGLTLSAETLSAGETLHARMRWNGAEPMAESWMLTVQILDAQNQLVTQNDAPPLGYPTDAWQIGRAFEELRSLTIPAATPAGDYRLVAGWYNGPLLLDGTQEIGRIRITQ